MFILPCWIGHLIKKSHKIEDSSQLQNRYKTTYCTDVSIGAYTRTVQDTQEVHIQVEAGSMMTPSGLQKWPRVGLTIYISHLEAQ